MHTLRCIDHLGQLRLLMPVSPSSGRDYRAQHGAATRPYYHALGFDMNWTAVLGSDLWARLTFIIPR